MVIDKDHIIEILKSVPDPEIPVLTILDLGMVKDVILHEKEVEVVITPTYSGCPAMDMIQVNIRSALEEAGIDNVRITTVLNPPWTTDWITDEARAKLRVYGIAPPQGMVDKKALGADLEDVPCPNCDSRETEMVSQFGSTPCKALYKCKSCLEPFDYFKCH